MKPDDENRYVVIANCEDELAVWPASRAVPASWRTIVGGASRDRCVSFLQQLDSERRPDVIRRVLESHKVHP